MHYLILCILSSTGIFIVFKFLDRKNIPSFPVIVINYLVASLMGFLINKNDLDTISIFQLSWIPVSIIIGILFIVMFFIIARSSQVAGISITTVASKMSVVFPIALSILIDPGDMLTLVKVTAIILALIGVLLTVYAPDNYEGMAKKITLPLILFVGMGIVDSFVKFAQHRYVENQDTALFSAVLFFIAFLTGIIIIPFRRGSIHQFRSFRTWTWGVALGLFNFGSIYMMVSALNYKDASGAGTDSSVIFGLNNIGIVGLSVVAGILIFSEKLKVINWFGILLSIASIILFTLTSNG